MVNVYELMKDLITNEYYSSKDEIVDKLNVFLSYGVITPEQYSELMTLTNEKYK